MSRSIVGSTHSLPSRKAISPISGKSSESVHLRNVGRSCTQYGTRMLPPSTSSVIAAPDTVWSILQIVLGDQDEVLLGEHRGGHLMVLDVQGHRSSAVRADQQRIGIVDVY